MTLVEILRNLATSIIGSAVADEAKPYTDKAKSAVREFVAPRAPQQAITEGATMIDGYPSMSSGLPAETAPYRPSATLNGQPFKAEPVAPTTLRDMIASIGDNYQAPVAGGTPYEPVQAADVMTPEEEARQAAYNPSQPIDYTDMNQRLEGQFRQNELDRAYAAENRDNVYNNIRQYGQPAERTYPTTTSGESATTAPYQRTGDGSAMFQTVNNAGIDPNAVADKSSQEIKDGVDALKLVEATKKDPEAMSQYSDLITKKFGSERAWLQLALAFNTLRFQPDQQLAAGIQKRLEQIGESTVSPALAKYLQDNGHGHLIPMIASGQLTGKEAMTIAAKQPKTSYTMMRYGDYGKKYGVAVPPELADEMVNVSSQGKVETLYDTPMGETLGKEGISSAMEAVAPIYTAAEAAPENIRGLDRTINIIKNAPINVGAFNEIKMFRDKLLTMVGSEDALERLTYSQILNSSLGAEVFALQKSLGLGARGMDTPAEREFMREVLTGNLSLTKDALLSMARSRRNKEIKAMERYNKEMDSLGMRTYTKYRPRMPRFDLSQYAEQGRIVTPAMLGR